MVVRRPSGEASQFFENVDLSTITVISASRDGLFLALVRIDGAIIVARIVYGKGEVRAMVILAVVPTMPKILDTAVSTAHFTVFAVAGSYAISVDLGTLRELRRVPIGFPVTKVAVDDSDAVVFVAGSTAIAVLSLSLEKLIEVKVSDPITALAVDHRGCITGHSDGGIRFWTLRWEDGNLTEEEGCRPAEDEILSLAVTPTRIAAGTRSDVFILETKEPGYHSGSSGSLLGRPIH
jgi:hypothetical protein